MNSSDGAHQQKTEKNEQLKLKKTNSWGWFWSKRTAGVGFGRRPLVSIETVII
jgi:hypothetical protein